MSDEQSKLRKFRGRGAQLDPPNRFDKVQVAADWEHLEYDPDDPVFSGKRPTEYLVDESRTVVSENDSPDINFRYSLNPYRGCLHGCAYCYARPYHEYLGHNAGLDFETKIYVKHRAPELFRAFLARPDWNAAEIVFSGVTDCYQPAEREFQLTRRCLEVALQTGQPVSIITKNALVARDLDVLSALAERNLVHVHASLPTMNADLSRRLEPRTSSPAARLRTITELRAAGVPVNVMMAPIIPGLTDSEIPLLLEAVAAAGAQAARWTLLRLPGAVKVVFLDWLRTWAPEAEERVESRLRACRDGELTDAQFGRRMSGTGPLAQQIQQTFRVFAKRYHLDQPLPPLSTSHFRRPVLPGTQQLLF